MPTLLIIDNRESDLSVLSKLLKNIIPGFRIITTSNSSKMLEKAQAEKPDTILIYTDMSSEKSLESCRMLKSDSGTKHIPLIMLNSINNSTANLNKAFESGVDVFLKDPLDTLELIAQIKAMLRLKDAEDHILRNNDIVGSTENKHTNSLVKKQLLSEIEDRKLAEEALMGYTTDGIVITDDAGLITIWNNGAKNIFGYSEKDVLGKPVTLLLPEKYRELHVKKLNQIVATDRDKHIGQTIEIEGLKKDGSTFPMEMSLSTWKLKTNRFFATIIHDITNIKKAGEEKKVLESQLLQAKKIETIGNLAGGIAHDFNNILFPIIGFTEMMLDDAPEGSDNKDSLNEILIAALRARDLVKQILTFSRQPTSELKPLKMQSIIKDVLKLVRASLPSTINIEEDIDENCAMLLADQSHIQQIAMNIITNAFHAMEDNGGTLKVELANCTLTTKDLKHIDVEPGDFIRFSVYDTGHGIKDEILNRIFDPYFTTKQEGKGAGLGLSVVHGLVKSCKGDISVTSEDNKGSVFNVFLPVMDSINNITENHDHFSDYSGNEHILLVDDEKSVLKIETKILERLGYTITYRTSGLEALETFSSSPDKFDLVITDMTMPGMTGETLALKLKKIRKTTPIILCSGFSEKVKAAVFDDVLMKPIVKSELSQKIRKVLDQNKGGNR